MSIRASTMAVAAALAALAALSGGCELIQPLDPPPPAGCQDRVVEDGTFTELTVPTPNSQPNGIAVGADGLVWFTELAANKIGRITPGGLIDEFTRSTGSSPSLMTLGPDGNLWYIDVGGERIGCISPTGEMHDLTVRDAQPTSIAAGPDGNVWFLDDAAKTVVRITPGGKADMITMISEFPLSPGGDPALISIAAGRDSIWFADQRGNRIGYVKTLDPHTVVWFPIPTLNSAVLGLALGADGNIWFAQKGRISRITPTGTITGFANPRSEGRPSVLFPGKNGDIWFVDYQWDRIGQITTCGTITEFVVPGEGSVPISVTVDSAGDVWFTQSGSNQIGRFHPTRVRGR
jgi:streptogramin lyase